jgi:Lrp/AsnC family transcriptional regulator for asnA, asnC and gidA
MSKFRLDEVDHQILDMLIDNTRVPFTDIAKKLLIYFQQQEPRL